MDYEWGRLVWWAGHNSDAIQAITAIATIFLTFALIGVTTWYACLTRTVAETTKQQLDVMGQQSATMSAQSGTMQAQSETMQTQSKLMAQQLAASFQPNLEILFTTERNSTGTTTASCDFYGGVRFANKGSSPIKLLSYHVFVYLSGGFNTFVSGDYILPDLIVPSGSSVDRSYDVEAPLGASHVPEYKRFLLVVCTDLVGTSQHWIIRIEDLTIAHYSPTPAIAISEEAFRSYAQTVLDRFAEIALTDCDGYVGMMAKAKKRGNPRRV